MARETDSLLRTTTPDSTTSCRTDSRRNDGNSIHFMIIDKEDDPQRKRTQRLVRITLLVVIFVMLAIMTIAALRPRPQRPITHAHVPSRLSGSTSISSISTTTDDFLDSSAVALDGDMEIHDMDTLVIIPVISNDDQHHMSHKSKTNEKFHRSRYNDMRSPSSTTLTMMTKTETTSLDEQAPGDDVELSEIESNVGMSDDEISLEGTAQHHHHNNDNKKKKCNNGKYSQTTLKRAYEMPFAALFLNHYPGNTPTINNKFEASDVIVVNGTTVYAVCDSLWSISQFHITFPAFSPTSIQIGRNQNKDDHDHHGASQDMMEKDEDSGYEAILHDDGHLYVIRESILHHSTTKSRTNDGSVNSYHDTMYDDDSFISSSDLPATRPSYHAVIEQLHVHDKHHDDILSNDPHYTVMESCVCEYEFEGDSKGFEGAIAVHDLHGTLTILGLCEGNHCSETRKKDKGHGRIIVMQKVYTNATSTTPTRISSSSTNTTTETCLWKTIRNIPLPQSVQFTDYSAISLDEYTDRVAVATQEDSQLYVGRLLGKELNTGLWDLDAIEFDPTDVSIYDFPKNNDCDTIYCNIEGIHWLNDNMFIAVSDKMKGKGRQHFRCFDKDQSVHAFVLP